MTGGWRLIIWAIGDETKGEPLVLQVRRRNRAGLLTRLHPGIQRVLDI